MKLIDCVQGSPEWHAVRLGRPTASAFDQIITPGGLLSKSADDYMLKLLFEWMSGEPADNFSSEMAARGSNLEEQAANYYELVNGVELKKIGFVLRDDERCGCSPDRLCGADGLVELKAPAGWTHIGYLLASLDSGDAKGVLSGKYKVQLQGQLYVCERAWVDIMSYNPVIPAVIIRVERDEAYIAKLKVALDEFLWSLDEAKEKIIKAGLKERQEQIEAAQFASMLKS
jgi:hypothetical protein